MQKGAPPLQTWCQAHLGQVAASLSSFYAARRKAQSKSASTAGQEEDTMSIFGKIKDAIFGSAKAKEAAPAGSAAPASPGASAGASPRATDGRAAPPASAPISQVDVEAGADRQRAAQNKQKLDWRTSIVDLMKAARSRLQPRPRARSLRRSLATPATWTTPPP